MASRLGSYETAGDADPGKTLKAAAGDFAAAAVVAVLLWPFPLIRLTLGLPWAVHGPLIVLWVFVVYTLYLAVSAAIWTRSAGMYFLDLGLAREGRIGLGAALRWGLGWALALVPSVLGARSLGDPRAGLPARLSGLVTVVAVPADKEGSRG